MAEDYESDMEEGDIAYRRDIIEGMKTHPGLNLVDQMRADAIGEEVTRGENDGRPTSWLWRLRPSDIRRGILECEIHGAKIIPYRVPPNSEG